MKKILTKIQTKRPSSTLTCFKHLDEWNCYTKVGGDEDGCYQFSKSAEEMKMMVKYFDSKGYETTMYYIETEED